MFTVRNFTIVAVLGLLGTVLFKSSIPLGVSTAFFGVFFILAFIGKVFSDESLN